MPPKKTIAAFQEEYREEQRVHQQAEKRAHTANREIIDK
jgi:hypothetical protein